MNQKILISFALISAAVVVSGCISHHETVYRDQERIQINFESETAGRLFYETLSLIEPNKNKRESKTGVQIPFVFDHSREVRTGNNVAFNTAVKDCDVNKDGTISVSEAKLFAEVN